MDSQELAGQNAIADFNAGIFKSFRAACTAHHHQQRLTPEQENIMVEWILDEGVRTLPPSHVQLREMTARVCGMNDDSKPLGKRWVNSFIGRNTRVASVVGRKVEASRTEAATPERINAFLQLFEATRSGLNIQYEDIWNMDETGIALGVCTNTRVLASARKSKVCVKSPEDREWVSIIEVISAVGQKLRCVVIFKSQNLQTTWFTPNAVPEWFYTTSEDGWTSNEIGAEWLTRIFLPSTAPRSNGYRMLIVDGHGSHTDIEFMWLCKQHRVTFLYLPAHASHILQPLDLAPFPVVKCHYRDHIRAFSALGDAAPVKKARFIQTYKAARDSGLSERVIRAGWRATGLCPFNPELMLSSSHITRPETPPNVAEQVVTTQEHVIKTPQRPQDLYQASQLLQ